VRSAQLNEGHEERKREDDDQRREEQCRRSVIAAVGWELSGVDRRIGDDVIDHGNAFNTRSNPGRTGD
jgi:hypothetical protein